jgi:hypothetical protein
MDRAEQPDASSLSGEAKARTPAYASFESSTDKLFHLLRFILRGTESFRDELETKLAPEAMSIATEIAQVGRPQGEEPSGQEARNSAEMMDDLGKRISDTLVGPVKQFTAGWLTVREWIPVLLVTAVEAYLKDVRIYAAKVDPAIMESSEQSASYAEVVRALSIEELTEELQSRWARKFVDDGGPERWIKRLTKMGARGYRPETANEMETLWGVRHLLVHSRGVATPEFVRRHPGVGAKVGESILIRSAQLTAWITVADHFVDVTDFYFVQRYGLGTVSNT